MRDARAAAGSVVFLVVAPGVVAGLVPWLLTGWDQADAVTGGLAAQMVGALLVLGGCAALLEAFGRFVLEGRGTPAPVAPTEQLVVGGLYRHVRNPMYLAVLGTIVGQALLFGRPVLLAYAAVIGLAMWAFVRWYEEPMLARRYGAQYEGYRSAVPGWRPRLRPWKSGATLERKGSR